MTAPATASRQRVDWVDYAKGFCIVFVVMMHSTLGVEQALGQEGWLHTVVAFAKPFRMPDFFLISGLFLAQVIDRDWRTYLDRKVVHFAYFYLLWTAIQFAVKAPAFHASTVLPACSGSTSNRSGSRSARSGSSTCCRSSSSSPSWRTNGAFRRWSCGSWRPRSRSRRFIPATWRSTNSPPASSTSTPATCSPRASSRWRRTCRHRRKRRSPASPPGACSTASWCSRGSRSCRWSRSRSASSARRRWCRSRR